VALAAFDEETVFAFSMRTCEDWMTHAVDSSKFKKEPKGALARGLKRGFTSDLSAFTAPAPFGPPLCSGKIQAEMESGRKSDLESESESDAGSDDTDSNMVCGFSMDL
jgi:hypothetical protein